MAKRARDRESDEKQSQVGDKKDAAVVDEGPREVFNEVNLKVKEKNALLEVAREKSEGIEEGSVKEKQRRKKLYLLLLSFHVKCVFVQWYSD